MALKCAPLDTSQCYLKMEGEELVKVCPPAPQTSSTGHGCRECDCEHRKELALKSLNETGSAGVWEKYLDMDCETENNPDWEDRKANCEEAFEETGQMQSYCDKYFQ